MKESHSESGSWVFFSQLIIIFIVSTLLAVIAHSFPEIAFGRMKGSFSGPMELEIRVAVFLANRKIQFIIAIWSLANCVMAYRKTKSVFIKGIEALLCSVILNAVFLAVEAYFIIMGLVKLCLSDM